MSVDIPFTTFRGQIKQLDTDFKLPIMREFFEPCFSAFEDLDRLYADLKRQGIARLVTAAGIELNFGKRPRRFAGGPGLPPGRYFTLCDGGDFSDRGTLRDEITAYYSGDSGISVTIFDPRVDPYVVELLQHSGMSLEDASLPLYYFVYRLERATDKNAALRQRDDVQMGDGIGITYGVRQMEAQIDQVVDLRDPDTQSWFTETFVALEIGSEESAGRESGLVFPGKEVIESFGELLPVIVSIETGGGMIFGQAVGQWLRQQGANALIFPSARSNAFVKVRNGKPTEWGGWNMVVYAGAGEALPSGLFGRMATWRDPDHDHIHVDYTAAGSARGSFSIRGCREFNLLRFDRKKQIACGVLDDNPVLSLTGVSNEILSRAVNTILDQERKAGRMWYSDVDYVRFVEWLESGWREKA
jgi:hypothetical protein